MNLVWKYVKPRFGGGVYKTQWMERGLVRLLEDEGLSYDVHMLNVSPFCASRVEVEAAAQFIHDALAQDVPVAFLNRHKGKEKALYTWHGFQFTRFLWMAMIFAVASLMKVKSVISLWRIG